MDFLGRNLFVSGDVLFGGCVSSLLLCIYSL